MLQSPSSSPFALALNAANVVLVVPNRHKSVYTRLWCAYEAYLSQEAGKPILIARTSTQARLMASMKYMSSSAALGCVLGLLARLYDWHSNRYVWMLALPAMLGTTIMDNKSRMIMHCFCEMYCWMELSDIYGFPTGHVWGFPDEMHTFVHTWFWVMVASFFCLLEVDRNEGRCNIREAEQLRDGYQGSIQYAECSQSTDAQNIMSEIGRRALNDVDFAIDVLLTAGMSTPALRKIALAGVDIEHAAYSEITAAVTMLGPFDVLTFSHMVFDLFYTKNELTNGELQALAIFFRLLLLLLLWKSEIDDRFFLLKVLTKAVGFLLIMVLAVCCIAILKGTSPLFSWLLLSNVVMAFVVLLGFLGIEGTARIPCGLQILQIFFARGTKVFASCRTVEPVHLQNFYQSRSTILCDDDFFALFGHGGREDTSSGASDDPMDATQDEGSSDGELVQSSAVRHAIGEVGSAVASGCVTTCGAAMFLLFCEIRIFTRFGQVLVVNMVCSLIFALLWIPAVLELCTRPSPSGVDTDEGYAMGLLGEEGSGRQTGGPVIRAPERLMLEVDESEGFAALRG
eukprot:symbB.v1.2.006369.t1/scaffold371.1/size308833/16